MKRSPELAPLSRDHHQALDAARRLRLADDASVGDAVARFEAFWRDHGRHHFEVEEALVLPAPVDDADGEWGAAVERIRSEHQEIRAGAAALLAAGGGQERIAGARALGDLLHDHVRYEERHAFPLLEERLPEATLAELGAAIERDEA